MSDSQAEATSPQFAQPESLLGCTLIDTVTGLVGECMAVCLYRFDTPAAELQLPPKDRNTKPETVWFPLPRLRFDV